MEIDFSKYQLVIFDYDNTLINENNYLFQVYKEIDNYLFNKYSSFDKNNIYEFLRTTFQDKGRGNLMDKMFIHFDINKSELSNCLDIMRTIQLKDKLNIESRYKKLYKEALKVTNVCVLTNGNPIQQKNKMQQTNWLELEENLHFYCANEYEKKPSDKIYQDLLKDKYQIKDTSKVLMIGDGKSDEDFAINIQADFLLAII